MGIKPEGAQVWERPKCTRAWSAAGSRTCPFSNRGRDSTRPPRDPDSAGLSPYRTHHLAGEAGCHGRALPLQHTELCSGVFLKPEYLGLIELSVHGSSCTKLSIVVDTCFCLFSFYLLK